MTEARLVTVELHEHPGEYGPACKGCGKRLAEVPAAAPAEGLRDAPQDSIDALTFAIEEFWPSDKPGAALLAGEVAAEILNYLDANGYTVAPYGPLYGHPKTATNAALARHESGRE